MYYGTSEQTQFVATRSPEALERFSEDAGFVLKFYDYRLRSEHLGFTGYVLTS